VATKFSKTLEIHVDFLVVLKLLYVNRWTNVVMLMVHFFAIFYCELAQNLFLALLLPIPQHICRSEFYFVAYQKLQCEGL